MVCSPILMEAESDITIHVHGYSFTFTVSWFYTRSHYLFLCTNTAEEAYLSIARSKDVSVNMLHAQLDFL